MHARIPPVPHWALCKISKFIFSIDAVESDSNVRVDPLVVSLAASTARPTSVTFSAIRISVRSTGALARIPEQPFWDSIAIMRFAFAVLVFGACGCAQGGALSADGGSHSAFDARAIDGSSHDAETVDAISSDAVAFDATMVDAMTNDSAIADGAAIDAMANDAMANDAFVPRPDSAMCTATEMRACDSACSTRGTATCSGGVLGPCVPPAESCNRADDDCDTRIDEGFQVRIFDPVPMSELSAAISICNGPNASIVGCMSAAKRWCTRHAWGCFNGGAGHLQATATGARIACFGHRAIERMTTYGEISAASGFAISERNVGTRLAQSAANRYCRTLSYEAGLGPVEFSGSDVWVTCLPSDLAAYTTIAIGEMLGRNCNPDSNPNTLACQSAADLECRDLGFQGGYGPVEWNESISVIICFR
jgi:hypothetical protein